MSLQEQVIHSFAERFGTAPTWVVRAPGRVNLIGEHTDYNDGFVLPLAIERAMWLALRPRTDTVVQVYSLDFEETAVIDLDTLQHSGDHWSEYIKGVAWALDDAGYALHGWDGVLVGDVPVGAGLSSSAALELVTARAFVALAHAPWKAATMARLSQRAENKWVGVNCGIMDQMISAAGQAGHALLIDCRSLETESVPLPPETAVVILDTATRRGLVDSAYNERRTQCETAAAFFGVPALRDVSLETFAAKAHLLDETTRKRARHIITENARTVDAAVAMRHNDAVKLGTLMDASHASLRDDFEVTNEALNTIVAISQQQPACYGARMTGAGFGGCAVALVQAEQAETFAQAVAAQYAAATGLQPLIYISLATDGAALVS
ncbi:MAG: galactokinase [Anaerolineales bacterium]|nr:galactokinase [Anaerolineales bacterium]